MRIINRYKFNDKEGDWTGEKVALQISPFAKLGGNIQIGVNYVLP